jgi:phosphoribosylformimino-5-aminoimidazole carboxamide ribotide isomerase
MAEDLLQKGAERVVLGTLAFSNPTVISQLVKEYGEDRVLVALDYKMGNVMVGGWLKRTKFRTKEALDLFMERGVKRFLLTSVDRDGSLLGPDLVGIRNLTRNKDMKVLASGGIRSSSDVLELKRAEAGGVVLGKSLYEGRITLQEVRKKILHGVTE